MRVSGPCQLKRTVSDQSDAIILTFNQKWNELLTSGRIDVVFRKQGPNDFKPQLIYAYVASPISAIVCRAQITTYQQFPIAQAVEFASRGCIDVEELLRYSGSNSKIITMELGQVFVAASPISCKILSSRYNYWPSSTFIPLSKYGVSVLDELGDFEPISKRKFHDE